MTSIPAPPLISGEPLPIWLPWTVTLLDPPMRAIPSPELPLIVLRSPAPEPPMVAPVTPESWIPMPFPTAAVPAALVPIALPFTAAPDPLFTRIPAPFPEITLPSPAAPIVVVPVTLATKTPLFAFAIAPVPAAFVPM